NLGSVCGKIPPRTRDRTTLVRGGPQARERNERCGKDRSDGGRSPGSGEAAVFVAWIHGVRPRIRRTEDRRCLRGRRLHGLPSSSALLTETFQENFACSEILAWYRVPRRSS